MKINVRESQQEDMPQVLELIKELALFEKEPEAVVIDAQQLQKDGFGEQPLFKCFVAEIEGNIEGMALVYFRYSTWKGKTVHLEDLVVRERFRGKGLGIALYKKVMGYALEQNVKRVEWVVLDWNEGAVEFYKKSGADVMQEWNTVQFDEVSIKNFLDS
ncbi:GNAT family N-acetyltransferase [Mesonia sp. MT50]|uniref:GNAT family N-acetyltransferase n=1 Tax=Mesonia profundi TaxID=3070998 RepID=A0ABU1A392_9FLAO|nr:GNAT family N-acetyltransferase [Mesonia profundi]MDQ7918100.1 GNAT family N-acetyltransferase [Mesonia profundi]